MTRLHKWPGPILALAMLAPAHAGAQWTARKLSGEVQVLGGGVESAPGFTSDPRRVVFMGDLREEQRTELFIADFAGESMEPLFAPGTPRGNVWSFRMSPGGDYAIHSIAVGGVNQLRSTRVADGHTVRLDVAPATTEGGGIARGLEPRRPVGRVFDSHRPCG